MVVVPGDARPSRGATSTRTSSSSPPPLDDAWMRDIGPTFVRSPTAARLGAVDWVFNGWGAQTWATWEHDARIGASSRPGGRRADRSPLVNEGGGIHVDGLGTVLLTETVQLDPGRNPGLTRADVEAELARTIGATTCVWLPRGLTRDYDEFGTRGHVDIVATIAEPGRRAAARAAGPGAPRPRGSPGPAAAARGRTGCRGRALRDRRRPAPADPARRGGPVDWSYINHLVVNGGVIACTFGDQQDDASLAILGEAYPGRRVVGVDARPLFARGGGIHCITQQQPAL